MPFCHGPAPLVPFQLLMYTRLLASHQVQRRTKNPPTSGTQIPSSKCANFPGGMADEAFISSTRVGRRKWTDSRETNGATAGILRIEDSSGSSSTVLCVPHRRKDGRPPS